MEIATNIGYLISIFNRYTEIYRDKTFEDMYFKENEGRHGWPAREWYGNLRDQQSVYCSWNTDKKGSLMLTSNREHMPRRSH